MAEIIKFVSSNDTDSEDGPYDAEMRAWQIEEDERQRRVKMRYFEVKQGAIQSVDTYDPIQMACYAWVCQLSRCAFDPAMKMCSLPAQAFWLHIVMYMWGAKGRLLVNGVRPSLVQLARIAGITEREAAPLWSEIVKANLLVTLKDGAVVCRPWEGEELS